MRTSAGVLSLLLALAAFGQATSPDSFLERGTTAFRAGDYSAAVIDLEAAAQGFMSPETMAAYVNTGKFEHVAKLEQALVFLALSQSRLGREGDARETILRLIAAERIAPTYERLQIAEAKELDVLAATLVPDSTLPPSAQVALAPVVPAAPVTEEETKPLPTVAAATVTGHGAYLTTLRQADALADNGDHNEANAIYLRVANTGAVPREILAEAAIGLYRTGAFRDSAAAFKRLGMFAKGEEDLRYYNAVALYEIGSYEDAKKELACALPFIDVTDEVMRYRMKIEQTITQQGMK